MNANVATARIARGGHRVIRRKGQFLVTESIRLACEEVVNGARTMSLVAVPQDVERDAGSWVRHLASKARIDLSGLGFRTVSPHVVEIALDDDSQRVLDAVRDAVVFLSRNPDTAITLMVPSRLDARIRAVLGEHSAPFELTRLNPERCGLRLVPAKSAAVPAETLPRAA